MHDDRYVREEATARDIKATLSSVVSSVEDDNPLEESWESEQPFTRSTAPSPEPRDHHPGGTVKEERLAAINAIQR